MAKGIIYRGGNHCIKYSQSPTLLNSNVSINGVLAMSNGFFFNTIKFGPFGWVWWSIAVFSKNASTSQVCLPIESATRHSMHDMFLIRIHILLDIIAPGCIVSINSTRSSYHFPFSGATDSVVTLGSTNYGGPAKLCVFHKG